MPAAKSHHRIYERNDILCILKTGECFHAGHYKNHPPKKPGSVQYLC